MNFFVSVIIIIIVIVRITKELLPGNIIHTILVTPVVKSPYFYRLYLMSIVFSDVRDLSDYMRTLTSGPVLVLIYTCIDLFFTKHVTVVWLVRPNGYNASIYHRHLFRQGKECQK